MRRSKLAAAALAAILAALTAVGTAAAGPNLEGFGLLAEIDGTAICQLTDNFDYGWTLEVEDESGIAIGVVDNAFPAGTSASGLAGSDFLDLTAMNQAPDGCSTVHDFFVVRATCSGNDCAGVIEAHCFSRFLYSVFWEGTLTTPCVSTLLFADGFESANMTAWSSAAP